VAAASAAGSLAAMAGLVLACPVSHVTQHILVFHVTGIGLAVFAGLAVARTWARREAV
jgi:hypothetical protein